MNDFLEISDDIVLNVENISFPVTLKADIKQAVVDKLGVKNIFKLNDRLDGVFFLNKHLKRVLGSYVVEKSFGLKLLDDEKRLKCLTKFRINNSSYDIIVTHNPKRIKIPEIQTENFLVVYLADDYRKARILGVIKYDDCLKHSESSAESNNTIAKDIISVISEENLKNIIHA